VGDDDGTGIFAGAGVNSTFTGTYNYGLTVGDACDTQISGAEAQYSFCRYGSFIASGGTQVDGEDTWADVIDNSALTAENADFFNTLTGTSLSAGDLIDGWGMESETPDTEFVHGEQTEGVTWQIFLGSPSSLYDNLDFRPVPPDLLDIYGAIFEIEEIRNGIYVYSASGTISWDPYTTADIELTPVPVPAAVWLFGSALGLLGWMRRKAA
jgi:hypothetical protein